MSLRQSHSIEVPRIQGLYHEISPLTSYTGANSRESHAKQKQLALERKASKPLADDLARTKKLWETLRRKSHVPKADRQKLVDELFGSSMAG